MYKTTVSILDSKLSSGLQGIYCNLVPVAFQLIPSDILGFQNIRPSTSRWASMTTFSRFMLALLTIFVSSHALAEEFRVHPSAFGPIRMGMQVEKASSLLGTPLIKLPGTYQENRYVVYPKQGFKGISFGVSSEGVITNVYVAYNAQNIKTNVGLHIGSPAQDLRRLYGEKIEVKAYQCANAFLIYTYRETGSGNYNYGIVYTVSENGIIEGIMSGDLRAEVEPC